MTPPRIYLSVPHTSGIEAKYVQEAIDSNWLSSAGPHLDAFEREIAGLLGQGVHTLAVSSGTAALHLILRYLGVTRGDRVASSSLTFAGSAFPILYQGAMPVFVDSERASWNVDPELVRDYLRDAAKSRKLPKVFIAVHLFGQHANLDPIAEACREYGVILVEDAAESLGATYHGRQTATGADFSLLSFNGNKIITTSGGGMVVAREADAIARMRKWSTQSREPAVEYLHAELGYNYRMSNILAGVGRAQLTLLPERIKARQAVAARYADALSDIPAFSLQPVAPWGTHTRWLTVALLDLTQTRATPLQLIQALAAENIEARPVWRPMHTQPLFEEAERVGGAVSEDLYARGICLPSSSSLTQSDQNRVVEILRQALAA